MAEDLYEPGSVGRVVDVGVERVHEVAELFAYVDQPSEACWHVCLHA
ncbi:MAG: hypothetical protein ACYC1D_14620 [Acidimicrobiales bacterium]